MIRIIAAAVLALAVTACARSRDNWGGISHGVGYVLSAAPAAPNDAARGTAPSQR